MQWANFTHGSILQQVAQGLQNKSRALKVHVPHGKGALMLALSQRLCWRQVRPQQAQGCWKRAPLRAQELPGLLQHASAWVSSAIPGNMEASWHAQFPKRPFWAGTCALPSCFNCIQEPQKLCTILSLQLHGCIPLTTRLSEVNSVAESVCPCGVGPLEAVKTS